MVARFIGSVLRIVIPETIDYHIASMHKMDVARPKRLRAHIATAVNDKATAIIWSWCKRRPAIHDDYLASFNRPNVALLSTGGKAAYKFITSDIVANGTLCEVDALLSSRLAFQFVWKIRRLQSKDTSALVIEPSKQATDEYTDEVQKKALWFFAMATCTPGWFNGEGQGVFDHPSPEEQATRS
ncbi:hypothetical protein BKA67DRAFT_537499 [Truncatella angustata]|uniref:Uncharacterized protein n=1 Tax=Truncatella angustata TaxID=152316 RepID=A0A9P8UGC3_9PEZI|nr:uncharacterized protein BKA67DRAFT_537499 [Truncatella angustata]KAH6651635.1 hypothetical protein BKA67DRAFT_537499 [Truncatella angustata]